MDVLRRCISRIQRCAEEWKNASIVGIVWDVLAQFLLSFIYWIVRRSFCIIFIFQSSTVHGVVDSFFAFLCCIRTVFVFTVSHDLHSQWFDVLYSFAQEGLYWIRPMPAYLPAYRFSACLQLNGIVRLVFLQQIIQTIDTFYEENLILSLPTAVNGTTLRAVMEIDAGFILNETHAREQIDF